MHPSGRGQPHEMRPPARGFQLGDEILQRRTGRETAILDGKVDLPQIHGNHPARADIGMPHLRVPHLPRRQTRIGPMGHQLRRGAARADPVEIGRISQGRGIGLPLGPVAPAIQDTKNHWLRCRHARASQTAFPAFYPLPRPSKTLGSGPIDFRLAA